VLPQTSGVVLTQAPVLVPQYVLAEATLSFLGLGVSEPVPSWGNMLAGLTQYHVLASYWGMCAPARALVVVCLSFHSMADKLQERIRSGPV
jgi:peptide/nickel transport system permease protein